MSNPKEKSPKSKRKAKNDDFVWTDEEVKLLVLVASPNNLLDNLQHSTRNN